MKTFKFRLFLTYLFILVSVAASQTLEQGLSSLVKQITSGMAEGNCQKIAVIEFSNLDGKSTQLAKYVSEELITRIFMTKRFNVVERQLLRRRYQKMKRLKH
jgi:TolB-like protein